MTRPQRWLAAAHGLTVGVSRWMGLGLLVPIRFYRYAISPMLPPACRFLPSCSEYALTAITTHGPLTGGWLAARRLCRCHPWHAGGLDPVPLVAGPGLLSDRTRWPKALRSPSSSSPAKME